MADGPENPSATPLKPFENGVSGDSDRDQRGRFRPGWKGGPGNPGSRRAIELGGRWDEALDRACTVERLAKAFDAVLTKAEAGDVAAYRAIAERVKGPPQPLELIAKLEALEEALARIESRGVNGASRVEA